MKRLALILALCATAAPAQDLRPAARPQAEILRPIARPAPARDIAVAAPPQDVTTAPDDRADGIASAAASVPAISIVAARAAAPGDPRPLSRSGPAPDQASLVTSETISTKTRPALRPDDLVALPQAEPAVLVRPAERPATRPELAHGAATQPLFRAENALFAFSPTAPALSLRPTVRPAAFTARAVERELAATRGQVCGDPAIQGQTIGTIAGSGACGVEDAVRIRSVAGVALHPQPTVDCRTASALKAWVAQGAKPAVSQIGGSISSLRVVSHYACRNRNNASGGRLSEHAFGRAIDIAGIGLSSGREITVLTDWNRGKEGQALRQMWRAACGPFGTVLGPEANRFHRDHFHFDTARYRSGSYCR